MVGESGGAEVGVEREAANVGIGDADADVEDALRAEGSGAADLEGVESGGRGGVKGAENGAGGAEESIGAGKETRAGGVDVDLDGGCVGIDGGIVDAEEEFVVPGGGSVAAAVEAGAQAVGGMDPSDGVGVDGAGRGEKVLSGD